VGCSDDRNGYSDREKRSDVEWKIEKNVVLPSQPYALWQNDGSVGIFGWRSGGLFDRTALLFRKRESVSLYPMRRTRKMKFQRTGFWVKPLRALVNNTMQSPKWGNPSGSPEFFGGHPPSRASPFQYQQFQQTGQYGERQQGNLEFSPMQHDSQRPQGSLPLQRQYPVPQQLPGHPVSPSIVPPRQRGEALFSWILCVFLSSRHPATFWLSSPRTSRRDSAPEGSSPLSPVFRLWPGLFSLLRAWLK